MMIITQDEKLEVIGEMDNGKVLIKIKEQRKKIKVKG